MMSFAEVRTGVPCHPFSVFSAPLLFRLPALTMVVGGGGRVYAWDWGVGGDGLVI